MKPQDHSDTTLLVWSDWLEENEQEQKAHDLREEIVNPPAQRWGYTFRSYGGRCVGGDYGSERVAGDGGYVVGGSPIGERVGGGIYGMGPDTINDIVGTSSIVVGGGVGAGVNVE